MSGRKIGQYTVLEKIGDGSFSQVFKAANSAPGPQQIDSIVAIKAVQMARLNPKLQEAMVSEIEILEKIRHKNIVRLFGCIKKSQYIYLILEYCEGGDLHGFIHDRGWLPDSMAQHFLRELAQGLEFLWKHHLVHRDLKPHNLLLTSKSMNSSLKIADFGFAKRLDSANMAYTLCGSPLYMAPEILQRKKYDAKADLWSVGTILFEMLTGKPPFQGKDPNDLLLNIKRTELKLDSWVEVSEAAVVLLRGLLKRDPVERITFQEFFESEYLALKPTVTSQFKHLSDVENPRYNNSQNILKTVLEDSASSEVSDKPIIDDLEISQETFDQDLAFALTATPTISSKDDSNNVHSNSSTKDTADWEIVEGVDEVKDMPQQLNLKQVYNSGNNSHNTITVPLPSAQKPPLPPVSTALSRKILPPSQQKRKHASGRATTFAIQVGERAVHLAKLAEKIVEAYLEFEEEKVCECSNAAAAAIVVEACRLLSLATAAADDAAEAACRKNRAPNRSILAQELRAWLVACRDKADGLLRSSSSSVFVPNPKIIMYRVALGLGRRAAGRELLLPDGDNDSPEMMTVIEDYSLGLLLLQLLTTNNELSNDDRKLIHGYLALFHNRLQSLE